MTLAEFSIAACVCAAIALSTAVAAFYFGVRARNSAANDFALLRSELDELRRQEQDRSASEIAPLDKRLALLERSARELDRAKVGLSGSVRAQAMQLLRSGISPESAASQLDVARREMQLLAAVREVL